MKNKELFDRTVSILVKAYLHETLQHADACACAVGNLVMACGEYEKGFNDDWFRCTHRGGIFGDNYYGEAKRQIDCTGYSPQEIASIEHVFENNHHVIVGDNIVEDEDGYLGLMAVVDCLMEIHECKDEKVKEETKAMFVKV